MNKSFLILVSVIAALALMLTAVPMQSAQAATPTELFFSEYIEGSSFNKAVEIYNGTGKAVDLSTYTVELYSNGSATLSQSAALSGALADGDVFVLANASADPAILAETDLISSTVINFNGDDALVLRNNGDVVDSFGQVGVDPGSEWTGGGQDDTLRRGDSICAGDTDPSDAFDASTEWVTFPINTFDGFGSHSAACGGGGGPSTNVIINEVDSDTPGTDIAEFVELYDGGAGNTALDGLVVVFYNGSNDLSYASYDLDGFNADANGYFLLGNAGVTPTPGISFASNGLQNGADAVALYQGDATSFPSGTVITTTNLIDALVYDTSDGDDAGLLVLLNAGQPQVDEAGSGDKDNHSNQRCPNGSGGARNTDTYAQFAPTPGATNTCVAPALAVKIHAVQGSGSASPLVGVKVAIEGIVVGDFQDGVGTNGDLNGFHVQEEEADADGDPLTSEGIFVYNGSLPAVDVNIGDLVQVEGAVSEFNDLTEITSFTGVTVVSSGNALPTASVLSLPVTNVDDFEAYEGMYVNFPQALVISEYFNFDRFNETVLTSERRLTPTAEFEPGPDAIAAANDFLLNKITLDDGRSSQNPDPAIHPNGYEFNLTNLFRGGDTVANVTGVMDYSFGLYRIQPTQGADYTNTNLRTVDPEDVGGSLKVASFNVLNYFSTLDDGVNDICGPAQNQECRGADNATEFTRQRDKIIAALKDIDADVVGLLEIENNLNDDAVKDLVSGLNIAYGVNTYDYVSTGAIGTDAIKVALIYKTGSVSLVGNYSILDSSVDTRFDDTKNRPTLAQTFMDDTTSGVFTVAVNHLKSKGSGCNDVGDPDLGDGAGNCNLTRKAAAEAMVDWLAGDPTGSGDEDFLIIGDLNSYDKEDPIDVLLAGGYTDLIYAKLGEDAYSYVFDGQTGYLDYALAGAGLLDEVTGITVWHINADEADLIDYDTSFKQDAQDGINAPDAYRSSDHDPVIIGLDLCDEIAPTFDELSVSPEVLWPANHMYVDVTATVLVSDNFDPNPTISLVSVTSNEPDNGEGDGNTDRDIIVVDDFNFRLRAERSGNGDGRIYTITYKVTDACGNSTQASVMVMVPKSQRDRSLSRSR